MNKNIRKIFEAELKRFESRVMDAINSEDEKVESVYEEVSVGSVLTVNEDIELEDSKGEILDIPEGSFAVVNPGETEGLFVLDVYDEDSNLLAEGISISQEDLDDLVDSEYASVVDDEDLEVEGDVEEAFVSFKKGKKKIFKLKSKKGFKRVGGKYVKISAKALAKMKMNAKKASRKASSGKAKLARKRTMKLRKAKLGESSVASNIGYEVLEGFDILDGKRKVVLSEGDVISFIEEGKELKITRDGLDIITGIPIDEKFLPKCLNESVVKEVGEDVKPEDLEDEEDEEDEETEEKVETEATEEKVEECYLTHKSDKGYILTKEGKSVSLGNRIRTRSYLLAEGYDINANILDEAFNGEKVSL